METIENQQLSAELQELYLENKEWISQLQFLKDEHRFFSKLFEQQLLPGKPYSAAQASTIKNSLTLLYQKMEKLAQLTLAHKMLIEKALKDQEHQIGLELIEQNAAIAKEIKLLLSTDRLIKKDLFALVEEN